MIPMLRGTAVDGFRCPTFDAKGICGQWIPSNDRRGGDVVSTVITRKWVRQLGPQRRSTLLQDLVWQFGVDVFGKDGRAHQLILCRMGRQSGHVCRGIV